MEQVVYFSLDKPKRRDFVNKTKDIRYTPKYSFSIVKKKFNDPRDLISLIDECQDRESLHVIIDYKSLRKDTKEHAKVLRHIIMAYPEVQFLFEEDSNDGDFLKFLFFEDKKAINENTVCLELPTIKSNNEIEYEETKIPIEKDFHTFLFERDECALLLVKCRNNLYDASNLRSAIKAWKFRELKVVDNYGKLTRSRRDNKAVVVEEEHHQNMYNGYCLYASGYGVFPVITATELRWLNLGTRGIPSSLDVDGETKAKNTLLIRDYDLQFIDENSNYTKELADSVNIDLGIEKEWNETDRIRGAKCVDGNYQLCDKKKNIYWKYFDDKRCYFLTKGGGGIIPELDNTKDHKPMFLRDKNKTLVLNGMNKPIEGVYYSMHRIKEVKERYDETRYKKVFDGMKYSFETARHSKDEGKDKDKHSCPLDIYNITQSMVQRAEKYYSDKKYRLAALVAGESMEILNGFHPSLMKRAYYVQAVSENAMSMSLLGGEESKLVDDINFRCRKIKEDITRMVPDRKDRTNVLNGIYNDCRVFCQHVEYHDAADEVLSFFVHENEGFGVIDNLIGGVACLWVKMKRFIHKKVKRNSKTETE